MSSAPQNRHRLASTKTKCCTLSNCCPTILLPTFLAMIILATLASPAHAAPSPPPTPLGFTSSVYIHLNPDLGVNDIDLPFGRFAQAALGLAKESGLPLEQLTTRSKGFRMPGQYYYNATTQKIRVDSAIFGGFVATFNLYGAGEEWIYTFSNVNGASCQKYPLKGAFPATTWLSNTTFINITDVWGISTNHWHGVGNHIGPSLGPNEFDFYASATDGSFVLLENSGFQQYFIDMKALTVDDTFFSPPSQCPQ